MERSVPPHGRDAATLARVPAWLLDRPVSGWNLAGGTFREELGDQPTLLVFLRHFG